MLILWAAIIRAAYNKRRATSENFQSTGGNCELAHLLQRYHHFFNMSQSSTKTPPTTVSSSNFNVVFEKALKAYKTKTKQDLTTHPLASQFQACNSPADILTVLQDQVNQFEHSRSADERLRRWLNPTVNVLYAFSATLGQGVSLVLHIS